MSFWQKFWWVSKHLLNRGKVMWKWQETAKIQFLHHNTITVVTFAYILCVWSISFLFIYKNHLNTVEGSAYTCSSVCTALYSYLALAWPQLRLCWLFLICTERWTILRYIEEVHGLISTLSLCVFVHHFQKCFRTKPLQFVFECLVD